MKLTIAFLAFFPSLIFSQTSWQKTYPHSFGQSIGRDVQPTADGGFIAVGEVDFPTGAIRHYAYAVKTDAHGNKVWGKTFNENQITYETAYSVRQTADKGFLLGGSSNFNFFTIRTDSQGDTIFTKKYLSGGWNDWGVSIRPLTDGGFLMSGANSGIDTQSPKIIRAKADGELVWEKKFPHPALGGVGAVDLELTQDGGFVFATGNGSDVSVKKLTLDADPVWDFTQQFSKWDTPTSLCVTPDGSIAGAAIVNGFAGSNPLIFKLSSDGKLLWEHYMNPLFHTVHSIEPAHGGGYILGMTSPLNVSDSKVFFVKTDNLGVTEWAKSFDGSAERFVVVPTSDAGYIGTGARGQDLLLIKIDSTGTVSTGDLPGGEGIRFSIAPNPVSGAEFLILTEKPHPDNLRVRLFNLTGRQIWERKFSSTEDLRCPTPTAEGIYFLEISVENRRATQKLIVLDSRP